MSPLTWTAGEKNADKNAGAVALGRLGARARNAKLTPEERSAIARKAGLAGGWPKGRKRKKAA